jgi:hypothetical protein
MSDPSIREDPSAQGVLNYLAESVFTHLPLELWDRYLWLYNRLLAHLAEPIAGPSGRPLEAYVARTDDRIAGIAVIVGFGDERIVYVDAPSETLTDALLTPVAPAKPQAYTAVREWLLMHLQKQRYPSWVLSGSARYWTFSGHAERLRLPACNVRELAPDEGGRFTGCVDHFGAVDSVVLQERIRRGVRYFGAFLGGRVVSIAGLCRLSRFRSEILSVCTPDAADRRHGYATAVCMEALRQALERADVCTWTSDMHNVAASRTAERIGMERFGTWYYLSPPGTDLNPFSVFHA